MNLSRFQFILISGWMMMLPTAAREANLINNSTFVYAFKCWKHHGSGTVEKLAKGARMTGGTLAHYIDLGNLEHAQPDCAAPAGRPFRFRIKARGNGRFRLGVRSRLMYAGNALEFAEQWSDEFSLKEKFSNFDFEAVSTDPDIVFHDKLMIKMSEPGSAEIAACSFFYLDREGPEMAFEPEAAAVRPGETVRVRLNCSKPGLKLNCSLYPGQFLPGGYFPAKHWETATGSDGRTEFAFVVPNEVPDGARLAVLDKASGRKVHFFATVLPEKMLHQYRQYGKNISGSQHLLFLGDSLSDYDRGRNYISVSKCFLPAGYTVRNCGVGGDTLLRIWQRLNGQKTTRSYMYDKIFSPKPDMIFIFTGANDSKLMSRNNYQTYVPENKQIDLWENIVVMLKKQTGAKIVLITSPDSYMPYQKALNLPLKEQGFNHSVFGIPEVHDRFNARLKQIAAKHGLDVIDFAAAVRQHPDPQLLYVQDDGVHLSLKGHQMLAGFILRYLAAGEKLHSDGSSMILDKKLEFNGSTRIRLQHSSRLNADQSGLTVIADIFPGDGGTDVRTPAADALDMYVFKDRQFFLGRYGNRLYANFHNGSRWCAHTMSAPGKFPLPNQWSQAAAVFEPLPGGYALTLYLNGQAVGRKTFAGKQPMPNRAFVELGSGWGGPWQFRGTSGKIKFFQKPLTPDEISSQYRQTAGK